MGQQVTQLHVSQMMMMMIMMMTTTTTMTMVVVVVVVVVMMMMMMMMMMTKGGKYMKLTTHLHLGARLYLQSSITCHGVALN